MVAPGWLGPGARLEPAAGAVLGRHPDARGTLKKLGQKLKRGS